MWLVFGQTGEYSDHVRWPVAAYSSREAAEKHADLAKQWELATYEKRESHKRNVLIKCPYDPNFRRDYTGTDWSVEGPFEIFVEPPAEVAP